MRWVTLLPLVWGALHGAGCQWVTTLRPWEERAWLKTALHTHTVHSDGEATPTAMLRWYRRNGFDVVALTDHNRQMPLGPLFQTQDGLLVLPGVEFTSEARGNPVHVNGLFTLVDANGFKADTPRHALQDMLQYFERVGAVAVINHPNYVTAFTSADLAGLRFSLLEVFNGSSGTRNDGDQTAPPVEALWDALLRQGHQVYGVATDDAHALPGGANPNIPGRAWIMVYARRELFDIRDALEHGRFYATTGPELSAFRESASGLSAKVRAQPGLRYRWTVVEPGGVRQIEGPNLWMARPKQGYRRARLDADDGSRLYLQPLFADQ